MRYFIGVIAFVFTFSYATAQVGEVIPKSLDAQSVSVDTMPSLYVKSAPDGITKARFVLPELEMNIPEMDSDSKAYPPCTNLFVS